MLGLRKLKVKLASYIERFALVHVTVNSKCSIREV